MSKTKIVVIDENKELVKEIEEMYVNDPDFEVVAFANNGVDGIVKIEAFKPDVVIIDIILSGVDGIGVMQSVDLTKLNHKPIYIVVSHLMNDAIINQAMSVGASYFIRKPVNLEILRQRVVQLSKKDNIIIEPTTQAEKEMMQVLKKSSKVIDDKINNVFLAIGIPAHIKGFQYLKDAVKMMMTEPDSINYITKKIYPAIAKKNKTEAPRVERAIRHAIDVSWNKGKFDNINKIVGMKLYTKLDKPSNGELIALVANKLLTEGI